MELDVFNAPFLGVGDGDLVAVDMSPLGEDLGGGREGGEEVG